MWRVLLLFHFWISRESSPDLATHHVDDGNAACAMCTFTELFLKCQNACLLKFTLNVFICLFILLSCILYKR